MKFEKDVKRCKLDIGNASTRILTFRDYCYKSNTFKVSCLNAANYFKYDFQARCLFMYHVL